MEKDGELIVEQLAAQIDLLTTLAVAICGGIVALVAQIAICNREPSSTGPLKLDWGEMLLVAFGLQAVSVLFGYLARGTLTNIAHLISPAMADGKTLAEAQFPGSWMLSVTLNIQFWVFLIGVVGIFTVICRNRAKFLS